MKIMKISFSRHSKRNLIKLIFLIAFLSLSLFLGSGTATAAPACTVPDSGNWNVNSDCDLVQNETVPQNVVVRNGATLRVLDGKSLNIDFSNFNLRVASDSRVLVERGGKIGSCMVDFPKPRDRRVDPDPNLDGNRFIEVLREKLPLDEHMGYVVVLQNSDLRNVAWDASGYAISNCDPDGPQAFTVDTRTAWGSVSKLITASVVASLAQDSDQVDLSDRFAPYMPNRWNLNPKFQEVTFAQLLGHRAGLRKSAGAPLRERLAKTFSDDPPVGKRSYSNTGAGIAGRMIMRAVSPGGAQAWERQHIRDSQQDYDDEFNKWASFFYLGFADSKVLSPSNIDWEEDASCNINQFKDNGRPYARRYRSGKDPNGRLMSDNSLSCFSGGWVMSARHMARFMRTLRHTNAIVNRETYANMATCRLGFDTGGDGYVRGPAIHKDGLITGNGYRYAAYVVMLPGGYTAVAASNSGSSSALRVAVRDAFNASYSPPLDQIGVENPGGKCVYW